MVSRDFMRDQQTTRSEFLEAILASTHPRKLIVAGPGTGKTFTFAQVLQSLPPGRKLALTFIRKLVADMNREFGGVAEVKTFHAYCKMLLHRLYGGVDLIPFLTQVISEDARALRLSYTHFDDAFQLLQTHSAEVAFYLARGDYYRAVSFNDSVYRALEAVQQGALNLPRYDQIVIDEFQDFNPLEVALIDLLQERGPILIVGDDDQAVYSVRNASPEYLRQKHRSGDYELFELPYCSRCPRVIVEATSAFVDAVTERGGFAQRIPRPFVPFLEDKARENALYPKILTATTANIAGATALIRNAIARIPPEEVREAHDKAYPCLLIVGQRQYLNPIHKALLKYYPHVLFTQAQDEGYTLADGYQLLLANENSNLGWRILAACDLPRSALSRLIRATRDGTPFVTHLDEEFIRKHRAVLDMLSAQALGEAEANELAVLLADGAPSVVSRFFPAMPPEEPQLDLTAPTILLSSFEGCKGLSAGHVFIVGLNDGEVPRPNPDGITDFECCKFIVAITRARKSLFLLSNRWHFSPGGPGLQPSPFVQMIPAGLRKDGGYVKAPQINTFLEGSWPLNP